jgi:hypothetical protein
VSPFCPSNNSRWLVVRILRIEIGVCVQQPTHDVGFTAFRSDVKSSAVSKSTPPSNFPTSSFKSLPISARSSHHHLPQPEARIDLILSATNLGSEGQDPSDSSDSSCRFPLLLSSFVTDIEYIIDEKAEVRKDTST